MNAPYRPMTRDQRADHMEALILLARLVIALPAPPAFRRTFFVMEAVDR